jgi:hypothetical protein
MLKPERVALELLEYKLSDLRAQRTPKGGQASVWALYGYLLQHLKALSNEERQRFEAAGQELTRSSARVGSGSPSVGIDDLIIGAATGAASVPFDEVAPPVVLNPRELEEQSILKRLAKRVWWFELEQVIARMATVYRAERERQTARLLYGLMRNFSHYSQEVTFYEDVYLLHFKVREPLPELSDPLVSLNDVGNIATLLHDLVELILTLKQPGGPYARLQIREEQVLDYLRRMAEMVARDPFAGRITAMAPKGLSSRQLKLAIEELEREPLREGEREARRRELESRLAAARAYERTQRKLFDNDVKRYRQAVEGLFSHLGAYLPRRVGGLAGEPQLPGGVLFAVNPGLRLEAVPRQADALTLRLKGPLRFQFAGSELAVTSSEQAGANLFVGSEAHSVESRQDIKVGRKRLVAFYESGYLHLRSLDTSRSLAALVDEALFVREVLDSPHAGTLTELMRVATGVADGDLHEVVRRAIVRFRELVAKSPEPAKAVSGFLFGALRAAKLEPPGEVVTDLANRLTRLMGSEAPTLERLIAEVGDAKQGLYQLGSEPLSLHVAGVPLTVRLYRPVGERGPGNVVVMMPDRPLGSFESYLVQPLGRGTLVCVRSESDLAVFYFDPGASGESLTAARAASA